MGKKIVSNEELCAALMNHGTIRETAKALQISERTIYNMMSESEFKEIYDYTQVSILNNVIVACQNRLTEAIQCITDIMSDTTINAQTRLQAAQLILKNTVSMYDALKRGRDAAANSHDCAIWDARARH